MLTFLFTKTPLAYLTQSLWRDEAFSYLLAKRNILDIISLTAKDFNPPLYYIILHYWMKIFGTSEISLRILSLIFFWGILYIAYLFLRNTFKLNLKILPIYLLFFLINPILNYYAFESRMYTMFAFLAALSFYFFITKKHKPYLISTILCLYTHYFTVFILLTQLLYIIVLKTYSEKREQIKSIIFSFIFFLPWLIFVLYNRVPLKEPFWIKNTNLNTLPDFPAIIYSGFENDLNFRYQFLWLLSLLIFVAVLVSILKVIKQKTQPRNLYLVFLMWTFFPSLLIFMISLFKPLFLIRYLIFCTVGLLLLLIFSFELIGKLKWVFIILIFFLSFQYNKLQIKYRTRADIAKTIHEIKTLAKPQDVVYVRNELDFFTVQYYFYENKVFIYGKNYDEIPNYVGKILISKDQIRNTLPSYPNKAFVLNEDLSYNIQALF